MFHMTHWEHDHLLKAFSGLLDTNSGQKWPFSVHPTSKADSEATLVKARKFSTAWLQNSITFPRIEITAKFKKVLSSGKFSLQHKTISIHIKESQFLTKCHNGAPLCPVDYYIGSSCRETDYFTCGKIPVVTGNTLYTSTVRLLHKLRLKVYFFCKFSCIRNNGPFICSYHNLHNLFECFPMQKVT